jgi:hypothetical protein
MDLFIIIYYINNLYIYQIYRNRLLYQVLQDLMFPKNISPPESHPDLPDSPYGKLLYKNIPGSFGFFIWI